jgi:hypothetical protein
VDYSSGFRGIYTSERKLTGPGWEGDEIEVEWSEAIKKDKTENPWKYTPKDA